MLNVERLIILYRLCLLTAQYILFYIVNVVILTSAASVLQLGRYSSSQQYDAFEVRPKGTHGVNTVSGTTVTKILAPNVRARIELENCIGCR
jgi:hypothetical protein